VHTPTAALPGALSLLQDPASQAVAQRVFEGPRAGYSPGAARGAATLVAGTVTVNTTAIGASSIVLLTGQNTSGTAGELTVSARVAGTSFTITSANVADTRSIGWLIFEP
jgi:hypothetical protein